MSQEFCDFTNLASTACTICLYQPHLTNSHFYYLQIIDIPFKLRHLSGKYHDAITITVSLQAITVSGVHLLSYVPSCSTGSNQLILFVTSSYNLNHHYIVQCNNE